MQKETKSQKSYLMLAKKGFLKVSHENEHEYGRQQAC